MKRTFAAGMVTLGLASGLALAPACQDGAPGVEVGAGAASGALVPRCDGPVCLRAFNASDVDFDSIDLDGIKFGPLAAGAVGPYQLVQKCMYAAGWARAKSGEEHFLKEPVMFCPVGEPERPPLSPGYYTRTLGTPAGSTLTSALSRDALPK